MDSINPPLISFSHFFFSSTILFIQSVCLFENNLFSWNWKLFIKNTVNKTKR